jgi:hypothetical protein
MAEPPPLIQSVIDAFEKRARRRQLGAYGFLGLMLAGIAAAAYVFIQAKEITDKETRTDITTKMLSLKRSADENDRKVLEAKNALKAIFVKMLKELPSHDDTSHCGYTYAGMPTFYNEQQQLKSKPEVIAKLLYDLRPSSDCVIITVYLGGGPVPDGTKPDMTLDIKLARQINTQEWNNDPSSAKNDLSTFEHQGELYNRAINTLQNYLDRQEIEPLIGHPEDQSDQKVPVTLSLPFLLQLNITRFGTISLVVITLGILAPLYRFSARLATFYQGRADMLRVHQLPGYKQTGIARLSPIFTPTFDFGKSQAMPDHLTEVIQAAFAHGKDHE